MPKLTKKCHNLVDKYGDKIADLILSELTPKEICRELSFCISRGKVLGNKGGLTVEFGGNWNNGKLLGDNNQKMEKNDDLFTVNEQELVRDPNTAYIHASDSTLCVVCQTVMTQLEKELADKSTQKEIEDAVKNICHSFPASFDKQCTKFIDNYATLIISLIDTTPPKQICGQINLCAPASFKETQGIVLLIFFFCFYFYNKI